MLSVVFMQFLIFSHQGWKLYFIARCCRRESSGANLTILTLDVWLQVCAQHVHDSPAVLHEIVREIEGAALNKEAALRAVAIRSVS